MKKILLLIFFSFGFAVTTFAQNDALFNNTWYLHYLKINDEIIPAPLEPDFVMNIESNGSNAIFTTNGIENSFEGTLAFDSETLFTFNDVSTTLLDCDVEFCDFENVYFYQFLTDVDNSLKTFVFNFETNNVQTLLIQDTEGNQAYYTNNSAFADPLLYQTWFLVAQHADLGPTTTYTPSEIRKITINPDLSYTAVDNCVVLTGNLIYQDDGFDTLLIPYNYNEDDSGCSNEGGFGYFGELEHDFQLRMQLFEGENSDFFTFEASPGFGNDFTNQLLSVEVQMANTIKIYPNPVKNSLNILSSAFPLTSIQILSFKGQIISTLVDSLNEIDTSKLPTGIYFVKLTSQEGSIIKKIIKK